jgi:hypothetical protein
MAVTLERPRSGPPAVPAPSSRRAAPPPPWLDLELAANPVARAQLRAEQGRGRSDPRPGGRLATVLVWTVVVPTLVGLVSNPAGWLVLFLLCLGVGGALGFGSAL